MLRNYYIMEFSTQQHRLLEILYTVARQLYEHGGTEGGSDNLSVWISDVLLYIDYVVYKKIDTNSYVRKS